MHCFIHVRVSALFSIQTPGLGAGFVKRAEIGQMLITERLCLIHLILGGATSVLYVRRPILTIDRNIIRQALKVFLAVSLPATTSLIQSMIISSAPGLPMCPLPSINRTSLTRPRLATNTLSSIGKIESCRPLTMNSRQEGRFRMWPLSSRLNFAFGSLAMNESIESYPNLKAIASARAKGYSYRTDWMSVNGHGG